MDNLEIFRLVLEYARALAWPLVAICALLLLRKELRVAIGGIRRLRLPGGTEIDLRELVDRATSKAEDAEPITLTEEEESKLNTLEKLASTVRLETGSAGLFGTPSLFLDLDYYRDVAATDPNLALAGLRMGMETLLRDMVGRTDKSHDVRHTSINRLVLMLTTQNILPSEMGSLLKEVAAVVNAAVHGEQATQEEALRTIDAVEPLRAFYRRWLAQGLQNRRLEELESKLEAFQEIVA